MVRLFWIVLLPVLLLSGCRYWVFRYPQDGVYSLDATRDKDEAGRRRAEGGFVHEGGVLARSTQDACKTYKERWPVDPSPTAKPDKEEIKSQTADGSGLGHDAHGEATLGTEAAEHIIIWLTAKLVAVHWDEAILAQAIGDWQNKGPHSRDQQARFMLTAGLYASLIGKEVHGQVLFEEARKAGATDPRIVCPKFWTSAAAVAFYEARP